MVLLRSFRDRCRAVKTFSRPLYTTPAKMEQGNILPSCFNHHSVYKLLFKIAPKHSAEVFSIVVKHKKIVFCLTKKICVLGKLGLSMS